MGERGQSWLDLAWFLLMISHGVRSRLQSSKDYLEQLFPFQRNRHKRPMMIEEISDISAEALQRFDAIIDVRTPDEFAEDHLPGAINLPVLSNAERAEVGTIYKQQSQFRARRIGAAYVARNVAEHLNTRLADEPKSFHPLLYCWRGGMRSNAMATILSQVGWRTGVVKGGYKTWRREVVAALRDDETPLNVVLLDGQTGTAKSEVLRRLPEFGVQIIDLEALANHRGSVFGAVGAQPAQKLFESRLWERLRGFDLSRPILIEAESNRIGRCEVPNRLWNSMLQAPRFTLTAPMDARADFLLSAYQEITANADAVITAINRLSPFHSKETLAEWRVLAESRRYRPLAEALMREHYDPLYDRGRKRAGAAHAGFHLDRLDDATFRTVAEVIASALSRGASKGNDI
jgi:tRNA 2-selenouridine synthase